MDIVKITDEKIHPEKIVPLFSNPENGATSYFFGTVRNNNCGKTVLSIYYDTFKPLTEAILKEICDGVKKKLGENLKIFLVHRIGNIRVGEISIAIGVSSPRRKEAISAVTEILEELKIRAPIWKREFYEKGESNWVEGHALRGKKDRNFACGREIKQDGSK